MTRFALLLLPVCFASAQYKSAHPQVKKVVESISEERVATILKKLESFGTRHTSSSQDDPARGIGAARKWIFSEFQSYSPKLQVSYDTHRIKKQGRIPVDTDLYNVIAVLPGATLPQQRIIISAHYDTLAFESGQNAAPGEQQPAPQQQPQRQPRDPNADAPGVVDDGSGVACVMELARVMSQHTWDKTLVFIAFAGEENGLLGSTLYADKVKKEGQIIEAVLNNDIIGSDTAGNGRVDNWRVNIFSEDPSESTSRQVARYAKEMGERYVPGLKVDLIFRADRFGRGGDHTPFNIEGFAAVRVSTPTENFSHQHSLTDTFANASVPYTSRVIRMNGAVAGALALGPKSPVVWDQLERDGRKLPPQLMLTRGRSRYDALLRWKNAAPEADLAGYVVVMRSTTSPYWEREVFVGNVTEYLMKDVSIDEVVFGVKAIDKEGNESLVTAYVPNPPAKRKVELAEPAQTSSASPRQ
jgi:hypothetical protein